MAMSPFRRVDMMGAWPARTPKSPSVPGTTTMNTASERTSRSGVTSSNWSSAILLFLSPSPSGEGLGWGLSKVRRSTTSPTPQSPPLKGRGGYSSVRFRREALGLLDRLLDAADHVEGRLGQMIILAVDHRLERADGVLDLDELAGNAGEHLGDVEGLREETLDLAGAADGQLILLRQLVHAEDGDDVLKRLVALEDLLDGAGGLVMLLADRARLEH